MTIQLEQEVKFQLASIEVGASKLAALGARVATKRHFESNILYDFPDARLLKRDEAFRLRRVGDDAWLTWKGPQRGSTRIKQRRELETLVEDADAVEGMLEALGMEESFRYEKYRTSYRLGDAVLTLDDTPMGAFMEIEAAPELIGELAEKIGLEMANAISASYPRLYERFRLETPDAPEFMVFGDASPGP